MTLIEETLKLPRGLVLRTLKIDGIHSSSNKEEGVEENIIVAGFLQDRVDHISSKSNRV